MPHPPINPPTPLPAFSALVRPEHMFRLFRTNTERAAYWHRLVTELWDAAMDPHPENVMARRRAYQRLAGLSRIAGKARENRRVARAAARQVRAAATLQSRVLMSGQGGPGLAVVEDTGALAGGTIMVGPLGFVDLDAVPSEHRFCTMCKQPYRVQETDGEARFGRYPVQLSCLHLVCFGCAKVLVRMHVNCTCCGATFGDGKAELAGIKSQIQSCSETLVDAVEAGNGEARVSDGVTDDGAIPTREDVQAALMLLNLAGKKFGMEDIDAGLALLDLKAGTDTTLEEYLLTISRL